MKLQKRPESLSEVTALSLNEETFGRNLADFEHELVRMSSRRSLFASIEKRPPLLIERFATGHIADAWLAAYAEELAFRFELPYPEWLWEADRFLSSPYIHDGHSARLKVWHTIKSPPAFSRRNLFVDVRIPPIQLRAGRPRKSARHKREMNRLRVARYRERGKESKVEDPARRD
ncbi:MAG: hypothetical protein LAT55_08960 [Opitutales bacterium]|nr:hypothetical protein [Opitutales bacterium]